MSKKGGKRKHVDKPKRKLGRYLLLVVLIVPLGFQLRHLNISMPEFDLPSIELKRQVEFTNVVIDGEFVFSKKERLRGALTEKLKSDFFRLDLEEIKSLLLENSWYRSVEVSRVWPSTLSVTIEEEKPIARWGSQAFVNRYGEVVLSNDVSVISHLPLLEGRDEDAYEIAKSYLTISQLLINQKLYITKLSVSKKSDWLIEINHDFNLLLGDRDITARIERFLYLYNTQLAPLAGEFARIDMRYQSGVAVQWKKQALAALTANKKMAIR